MARGKISLARGINCCPIFFLISVTRLAPLYCEECQYMRISDWVETVFELLLLPNNPSSETFLHKSGAMRSLDI